MVSWPGAAAAAAAYAAAAAAAYAAAVALLPMGRCKHVHCSAVYCVIRKKQAACLQVAEH